jgi:hypothetical protein
VFAFFYVEGERPDDENPAKRCRELGATSGMLGRLQALAKGIRKGEDSPFWSTFAGHTGREPDDDAAPQTRPVADDRTSVNPDTTGPRKTVDVRQ